MIATVYKALSNEKQFCNIQIGKTLQQNFPDIPLDYALFIVNGKETKGDYIVQLGDIVTVRVLPGVTGTLIVLGVLAAGAAIAAGVAIYKQKVAAEKMKEEMDKMKKRSGNPSIDNRPFLRGATNTKATGNSQPYICGRHFFTPYLMSDPFYVISGSGRDTEQFVYNVFECGFNKQVIDTIAIDDIKLRTFPKDSAYQQGSYQITESLFAEGGLIEISQEGNEFKTLTALNYKHVSTNCNEEIYSIKDINDGNKKQKIYSLDSHAKDIELCIKFPQGFYKIDEDGDKVNTTISVNTYFSFNGGKSWSNAYPILSNYKDKETDKELRFTFSHSFSLSDYKVLHDSGSPSILMKVSSDFTKASDGESLQNTLYLEYYQSLCFDAEKSESPAGNGKKGAGLVPCKIVEDRERQFCTLLALKLKASPSNEEKLKKVNIISTGTARIYNSVKGEWTAKKYPTRNSAAVALEILTSSAHPASRFSDSEVDLEAFGSWYDYCEKNGFRFDYVISQKAKKDDTLQLIADSANAVFYIDIYGRRSVAFDDYQENAVAVYNADNIIDISHERTLERRADAVRVKYTNSKNDLFQEDTYLVMKEGKTLSNDTIIKDLTVSGITEHEQIVKYARRVMAIEALRNRTTKIKVGNEGIYLTPYSKILLQDDSLKVGLDKAQIVSTKSFGGRLSSITVDHALDFHSKQCGIIVNAFSKTGLKVLHLKVLPKDGEQKTDTLLISDETPVRLSDDAIPEAGNMLSFGLLDNDGGFTKISTPFLIASINRSGNEFSLDLVSYNEAIYKTGLIPPYSSNITEKKALEPPPIPQNFVTHNELEQSVTNSINNKFSEQIATNVEKIATDAAQEAAFAVTHGVHFTNHHRIETTTATIEDLIAKIDDDANTAITRLSCVEGDLSSTIDLTEKEIRLLVANKADELYSAINMTSTAVETIVKGGGALGRIGLSLELPALLTQEQFEHFCDVLKEQDSENLALIKRVYGAQVEDLSIDVMDIDENGNIKQDGNGKPLYVKKDVTTYTGYYTILGNASEDDLKSLWQKCIASGLIASQIDLSASQIKIAAEKVVFTKNEGGSKAGETLISGGYLKNDVIDTNELFAQKITVYSQAQKNAIAETRESMKNLSADEIETLKVEAKTNKEKYVQAFNNAVLEETQAQSELSNAENELLAAQDEVAEKKLAVSELKQYFDALDAYNEALQKKENAPKEYADALRAQVEAENVATQKKEDYESAKALFTQKENDSQNALEELEKAQNALEKAKETFEEAQSAYNEAVEAEADEDETERLKDEMDGAQKEKLLKQIALEEAKAALEEKQNASKTALEEVESAKAEKKNALDAYNTALDTVDEKAAITAEKKQFLDEGADDEINSAKKALDDVCEKESIKNYLEAATAVTNAQKAEEEAQKAKIAADEELEKETLELEKAKTAYEENTDDEKERELKKQVAILQSDVETLTAQASEKAEAVEDAQTTLTNAKEAFNALDAQGELERAEKRHEDAEKAVEDARSVLEEKSKAVESAKDKKNVAENALLVFKEEQQDGSIQSGNYQPITTDSKGAVIPKTAKANSQYGQGWIIKQDGTAEFSNVKVINMEGANCQFDNSCTFGGNVNIGNSSIVLSSEPSYIYQRIYPNTNDNGYHNGDWFDVWSVEGLEPKFSWVSSLKFGFYYVNAFKIRANYDKYKVFRGLGGYRWRYDGKAELWIKEDSSKNWKNLGAFWYRTEESTIQHVKNIPENSLWKLYKTNYSTAKLNLPKVPDNCRAYSKDSKGNLTQITNYLCIKNDKVTVI